MKGTHLAPTEAPSREQIVALAGPVLLELAQNGAVTARQSRPNWRVCCASPDFSP